MAARPTCSEEAHVACAHPSLVSRRHRLLHLVVSPVETASSSLTVSTCSLSLSLSRVTCAATPSSISVLAVQHPCRALSTTVAGRELDLPPTASFLSTFG